LEGRFSGKPERGEAMSGYDIFAWIVLVILIAVIGLVFYLMGSLPGHIARRRGHPWPEAVTVAGWVTLIFGFALWPVALIWAYVDVPARRMAEPRP
jgi:uncharacterized BrkB/YihY/UPF0761 family membrane protein